MANTSQKRLLRANQHVLLHLARWIMVCTAAMLALQAGSGMDSYLRDAVGLVSLTGVHLGALVLLWLGAQRQLDQAGWALSGENKTLAVGILRDTCYLFGTLQVTTRILPAAWYLLVAWPLLVCASAGLAMAPCLRLFFGWIPK